jgi:hypothetical protein
MPPLPGADGPNVTQAVWAADHPIFHAQALFAIVIDKQPGGASSVPGLHVAIPEVSWL